MRCGIYSLAGLVANSLKQNPLSGDVFIFIGKAGNQIRLLQWDKDGYALYIKRLETGTFERPTGDKFQLSPQELMLILQGIKLKSVQLRKRYSAPLSS
jgi:transposase